MIEDDGPGAALRRALYEEGFVHVRGALPGAAVQAFLDAVRGDLAAQGVELDHKWPRGGARRVSEAMPLGGAHIEPLRSAPVLCAALDAVLGEGGWELNQNGERSAAAAAAAGELYARHWYCPIAWPEAPPERWEEGSLAAAAARQAAAAAAAACVPARVAELLSCKEEEALRGPLSDPRRWQPVSRRRVLNKGWHVDVGPGFGNEESRSPAGDFRQGCVMLVLLSDCPAGCGGTAIVPRSHFAALAELEACEARGQRPSHQAFNSAFVKRMRALTERGQVLLECSGCGGVATCACAAARPRAPPGGFVRVVQVVGNAGDVVLLHPLVLHSGTTNAGFLPRVLANGMARLAGGALPRFDGAPNAVMLATAEARERLLAREPRGDPSVLCAQLAQRVPAEDEDEDQDEAAQSVARRRPGKRAKPEPGARPEPRASAAAQRRDQ
jgi:hypothetical protein